MYNLHFCEKLETLSLHYLNYLNEYLDDDLDRMYILSKIQHRNTLFFIQILNIVINTYFKTINYILITINYILITT